WTKVFKNAEDQNSRFMKIDTRPLHYLKEGNWEDINLSFLENPQEGTLECKENMVQISISADLIRSNRDILISDDQGNELSYKLMDISFINEENQRDIISKVCKPSYCSIQQSPQKEDYVIRIGTIPNTMNEYQSFADQIKHNFYFLKPLRK